MVEVKSQNLKRKMILGRKFSVKCVFWDTVDIFCDNWECTESEGLMTMIPPTRKYVLGRRIHRRD